MPKGEIETLWLEINIDKNKMYIGGVYGPQENIPKADRERFFRY